VLERGARGSQVDLAILGDVYGARVVRWNSRVARCFSSRWMALPTLDLLVPSRSAASVKLPVCATATNAVMSCSEAPVISCMMAPVATKGRSLPH